MRGGSIRIEIEDATLAHYSYISTLDMSWSAAVDGRCGPCHPVAARYASVRCKSLGRCGLRCVCSDVMNAVMIEDQPSHLILPAVLPNP